MQTKNDSLGAWYLDMKDHRDLTKKKLMSVRQERSEYERVLHEVGFATISEVEAEALRVVQRCVNSLERYGATSWELDEEVVELKRLTSVFKIVVERQPIIREWLDAFPDVQPGLLQRGQPSLHIISQQNMALTGWAECARDVGRSFAFPAQVNPPRVPRLQSAASQSVGESSQGVSRGTRSHGASRSRGSMQGRSGGRRMSIDDILRPDIVNRRFNYGPNYGAGPSL